MNAVALVVAVVALILTLGTTWLSAQMARVQVLEQNLRGQLDFGSLRERAIDALLGAKGEVLRWAASQGTDPVARATEWAIWLEMLMSPDAEVRFIAFDGLQVLNAMPKRSRRQVAAYTGRCDDMARLRIERARAAAGGQGQPKGLMEIGRWCLIFDEEEQVRYEDVMSAGTPA